MKATGILEYTRKCRVEGALLARIAFLCVLYATMALITVFFSLLISSVPSLIIFGVLTVCTVFATKPFLSEQRDYEIVDGSFRVYKVYGRSASRKVFECELRDMIAIAPYDVSLRISGVSKVYDFLSDGRSADAYYAIYEKNGQRIAVIFDGDEKFRTAASFYARRAFSRF